MTDAVQQFHEEVKKAAGAAPPHPYHQDKRGIFREKGIGDTTVSVPLSNFTARITAEEVRDDGAERRVVFTIAGKIGDEPLPEVTVPAERFNGMGWVTESWGNRAVVYAGQGAKDHLRAAIQLLSGDVPRRTVYEHLGWRKIDGRWFYLHAGGAIGAQGAVDDIAVEPEEALRAAELPPPPDGEALTAAVRASLELLDVAPQRLTVPLLAACYRAPLAEVVAPDFSLFYAGPTGAKKTSLTALAQAHFGAAFDDRHLPAGWEATGNALERLAFVAKDALLVIDDFCPKGTAADVQRLHREADRVLRAQGNRQGRLRMRPDGTLRPVYTPRGLIVSSGEDIPAGQSLRARLLILEVAPGDVDLEELSRAQQDAAGGLLAASMAGYVRWLAARLDTLREALPARKRRLRDEARRGGWPHDRTPDLLANLALGWEAFLAFAEDAGAITAAGRERLWAEGWAAMAEAAREQAGHQESEEPTAPFLALLSAAIASGRAHVADAETGAEPGDGERWGWRLRTIGTGDNEREEWQAQGERVGWLDGEHLLLEPDAAFAMAQRLARDQGTSLPITQRTLWKRMAERGLILVEKSGGRSYHTPKRTVAEQRRRVVVLLNPSDYLISHDVGNVGNVDKALNGKAFGAQKAPTSPSGMWAADEQNVGTLEPLQHRVPTFSKTAPTSPKECGRESWPETLVPQGPAHDAHKAHEMEDDIRLGFSRDAEAGADAADNDLHDFSHDVEAGWL